MTKLLSAKDFVMYGSGYNQILFPTTTVYQAYGAARERLDEEAADWLELQIAEAEESLDQDY